jgi:hypothetical protein
MSIDTISKVQAILGKIWSKTAPDLDPGLTEVHGEFLVRVSGCVEKGEDSLATPTVSIPLITTLAFCFEKLGVDRDSQVAVLRTAIHEAMEAEQNEDSSIKARIRHVSDAVDFVKREILQTLPKMQRQGRLDTRNLRVSFEPVAATTSV